MQRKRAQRIVAMAVLVACFVVLSVIAIDGVFNSSASSMAPTLFAIIGMVVLSLYQLRSTSDSDYVKARQSDATLDLSSKTVTFMREGLSPESAQAVCELLLPAVSTASVAITDREKILGFVGLDKENHEQNTPIQTEVTRNTLEDGKTRVVETASAIGFKGNQHKIKAAIVVPLVVRDGIVGTLKFYYTSPRKIDETQLAMAEGLGQLLSTQLSLSYLEQQAELASRMELKALQAQINPHFLFNTINTIASYTRTDPAKARTMLREFAIYYRRLLENSEDLIDLSAEIEQTERYLMFQRARFGEDAIQMDIDIEAGIEGLPVPAFIVQPIVENAVGHGRREEGTLHIAVKAYHASDSAVIEVADDGVGIPADKLATVVEGGSSTGMGIAMKNVNARLKGYFGAMSGVHIASVYGEGTTVYLTLYGALAGWDDDDDDDEEGSEG